MIYSFIIVKVCNERNTKCQITTLSTICQPEVTQYTQCFSWKPFSLTDLYDKKILKVSSFVF